MLSLPSHFCFMVDPAEEAGEQGECIRFFHGFRKAQDFNTENKTQRIMHHMKIIPYFSCSVKQRK